MGASSIERHITLDRAMYGSDQAASLEVQDFLKLVRDIRTLPVIMGNGEKILSSDELVFPQGDSRYRSSSSFVYTFSKWSDNVNIDIIKQIKDWNKSQNDSEITVSPYSFKKQK